MAPVSFFCAFIFLLTKEPQFLAEVSIQRTTKITDYYVKLPEVYRVFLNYPILCITLPKKRNGFSATFVIIEENY
ncbi:hypothetical protein RHABOEDO_000221 [Candidatus Rhabdochlamydia oedothoracis]|uniref:Secreted protein n=1 Tax=Candidatus Rhabdochlamydia oedothoracis TaxID=2720720 RepID=A0ABX8UYS6_9BACT|nr:hypothetical protein RHOW815_000775 [Candidatus Rhabdochlamydia sp. W815]QYF48119.1 hypothetical protein RHABOEDO_000221 [Candidatus Rhabdochlamydia oedothoracis]